MSDVETTSVPVAPSTSSRLISASALMAAGTLTSRVLGFGRLMLLVLLFGNGTRQADMFTYANTVPNSMYILLAGGVLNSVLVPQIVRAIRADQDGGAAYTDRIMTAGLIVLGVITVALTLAAPLIIRVYTPDGWHTAGRAAQYGSMVMLAYYCLPQVFFYGVHVLAGQVLNARNKFGPMMWAPIANNVLSILVLVLFLVVFGHGDKVSAFSSGQELLLGLGSTLGIAAQAAVLIPFLRAAGYRFRPRFDFRNAGLGHTFGLAKWTLGFVLVTQAALIVVYRLAGSATAAGQGAGLTVYTNAYAVWILPHSLITVSLATAMLPTASRLAAAGDLAGVRTEVLNSMRLVVTALLPAAVALIALGPFIARLAFGFGQGADDAQLVGWPLMALGLGLVPFTLQYLCLRAYYSLEDTRTTFLLQLVISGVHVLLAVAAVTLVDRPSLVATGLALAYSGAYSVGVLVSFRVLRRRLPGLSGADLVRHCARLLLAVAPAAVLAWLICEAFTFWSDGQAARALALALAGVVAVAVFLAMSRLLRLEEVNEIVSTLLRRPGAHAPAHRGGQRASAQGPISAGQSATAVGEGDDPGAPGDSSTAMLAMSPTIEAAHTATPSASDPDGLIEDTESMVSQSGPVEPSRAGAATGTDSRIDPEAEPTTGPAASAAATIAAGTVLAGRYRLEELLASSEPTVTWRAFDQVLSRSVLVHLLPPRDPGALDLLAAARSAAMATDSRFLRVLDAVHSDDPQLGSYIVCEYAVGQSLERILGRGPLSGLEAAWLVREVADALSGVHAHGLFHRRINPDTVIVTPTGNIKIVGLMIEATLRPNLGGAVHGADTPELTDVTDLGRLLYAALVARWPGGPAYGLADAPSLGRRWMTPRQVRAGVSPALDQVCDQILGEPPRHRARQLGTTNDVVNALTKVLGTADASGDLERRLRQPIPKVLSSRANAPVSSLLNQRTEQISRVDLLRPASPAASAPPPATVFPSAHAAVHQPAATAPAEVPSFADAAADAETAGTTVIRQPPPPTRPARVAGRSGSRPLPTRSPSKARVVIAVAVLLAVLLLAGAVVAALVVRERRGAGTSAGPEPATTSASPSASILGPVPIEKGRDFDPQGRPRQENPDQVKFAFDQLPNTQWRTLRYLHNPKLGGLKRGVGIVLDLGRPQPVGSVKLSLAGSPTAVQIRVPKEDPERTSTPPLRSDARWRTVSDKPKAGESVTLDLDQSVTTRFVLVYLTSLPPDGGGYRGGIYEVQVLP